MITLSLPRSGACNLAILNCAPVFAPRLLPLCLRSRNAILQSVLLVQLARPGKHFDQLRCCVGFRISLLACSAPWLSGVLSELKPGFLQIVFSRIRRRVHDLFLMTISAISWRDKELNSMEEAIKKDFYALFTVCHMITRKINRRQYLLFVSKHQKSTQL